MFVRSPRRGVDEQVIQFTPFDVFEELLDQAVFFGAPPYDCVVAVREHELDAHHAQIVADPDGTPARVANVDGFLFDAHHFGDAGAADVGVHYSDHGVGIGGEGVRKHGRKSGFSDAAFSREDKDFVFYVGEAGGYEGDVGVGALWGGGADNLVGAAGAGIGFAGLIGFRPRTMFWEQLSV